MLLFKAYQYFRDRITGTLFLVIVLFLAGFLSACGFRPLYGKQESNSISTEQNLSLIEIKPISNRIGQQLHNNLLNRLNPKGRSDRPLYSLAVNVTESTSNLGVQKSAVVTRGNLRVTATFALSHLHTSRENVLKPRIEGDASLISGRVSSTSSYDIPQAQYTALAAVKDARTRAVRELADDIRTRLAIYFQQASD